MFPAALVYLCVPLYIWLFSFLNLWLVSLAAVVLAVLSCCLWQTQRQQRTTWPQPWWSYWPLLTIVTALVFVGIWSPFNYWDWQKHFSIFNLLIDHPWPTHITLHEEEYFLRYGIGWYLVPALFAKLGGSAVLTPTMFVWTLLGTCLALLLALRDLRKWWHLLLATLIFFFFSGLDLVGAWYVQNLATTPIDPHWLQWWAGWGQIAPNLFGITWVPQHALPAWLGIGLLLAQRRLAVHYGAMLLATVLLWSPFAAIGLVPFFLYALCREGIRTALTLPNLVLAPLVLVPLVLYFSSGAGQIPLAWATSKASVSGIFLFAILEFAAAAMLILVCEWRTTKGQLLTALLTLTALTLVRFGTLNDLLMRASIPAVALLSVLATRALLYQRRTWFAITNKTLLVIYLLVAAVPVGVALVKGSDPRTNRINKNHRFTNKSTLAAKHWRRQYLARPSDRSAIYLRE